MFAATKMLMKAPPPKVVSYDATGAGYTGTSPTPSWAHVIGTSATAIVLSTVIYVNSTTMPTITAKVGTTPMIPQGGITTAYANDGSGWLYMPVFVLLNPPTGSQTVAVTLQSGLTYQMSLNSFSYNNVVEFGPVTTVANTAGATALSISVPSVAGISVANQMVANAFGGYTGAYSAYTQTQRWLRNWVSGVNISFVAGDAPGAPTVTFGCTCAAANAYGAVALALLPVIPVVPASAALSGNGMLSATAWDRATIPAYLGGSSIANNSATGSLTFTETIPAGTTCALLWVSAFSNLSAATVTIGGVSMINQIGLNVWQVSTEWYWQGCFVLLNPPTGSQTFVVSNTNNYGVLGNAVTAYYGNVGSVGNGSRLALGSTALAHSMAAGPPPSMYAQYFMTGDNAAAGTISAYNQTQRSPAAAAIGSAGGFPAMSGDALATNGTLNFAATASAIGNGAGSLILPIGRAIPYDATGTGYFSTTSAATVNGSFTHTAARGATVIVGLYTELNAGNGAATQWTRSATYGGVPMTSLGAMTGGNSGYGWVELFALGNVPGGPQTVVISVSGGPGTFTIVAANSLSYLNVGLIGPAVTNFVNGGTAMSSAAVASGPGQRIVNIIGSAYATAVSGAGFTAYSGNSRYAQNAMITNGWGAMVMGDALSTSPSTTITATSPVAGAWSSVAVALSPG
jgi:hypothetical protein